MPRAMGLDVGTKTIGVALSDPTYLIAQPYQTIKRKTLAEDLEVLRVMIEEKEVDQLVIGLPKHMNNDIGVSCQRARSLGSEIEKQLGKPVIYQDERLSTVSANRILMEKGVRRENRKKHVDAVAASYILQTWLDGRRRY